MNGMIETTEGVGVNGSRTSIVLRACCEHGGVGTTEVGRGVVLWEGRVDDGWAGRHER